MRLVQQPLCPIGDGSNGSEGLLMDSQGQIYGGFDNLFVRYGKHFPQALESIISHQQIFLIRDGYPASTPNSNLFVRLSDSF